MKDNNKVSKPSFLQSLSQFIILLSLIFGGDVFGQTKHNIVLMMTDDQGYGDISFHGNPFLKTPNLEALAKSGIEMTHFFTYPSCSPTRAGLMTGRYPFRTGVVGVTQVEHLMNTSEVTIAEILGSNGYRTGIFGKWHIGDNYPMRPTDQGFQESLVHKGGGIGQAAGPSGNSYFNPILEHNNVSKQYNGYCDDIFTDAALDFMSQTSKKPFFLYLASNLPHFPLDVPDERADPYRKMGLHEDNALTYGMVENIDINVGRVLAKLKQLGIENNTIVIFMSDNGPRDRRTKNDVYPNRWVANLRGTKTSVYENGTRVPFIVKWPGKLLPEGTKLNTMGAMIDIFPTLLDVCKIDAPKNTKIDGRSLLPLWQGKLSRWEDDREFITQLHGGPTPFKYVHFAVRTQKYKLIAPQDNPHGILYHPKDDELRKILASLELYDVELDPSERINLASKHPEIVEDLLARYENWFDEVTQERDSKGIQKIIIGDNAATNVSLSRFDWGGVRAISGTQIGESGFWEVQSVAGTYNITVTHKKTDKNGTAHLRYKDVYITLPVNQGSTKTVFENVRLPEGTGRLQAYLKTERLQTGPSFVEVEKLSK